MESLSLETLMQLAQPGDTPKVSVYMPTQRFGPGSQEADSTRLKNLLRQAEMLLEQNGIRGQKADHILQPGWDLLDDRPFWLRSRDGLALFLDSGERSFFQVDMPMPELVYVGKRAYVRPLIPLMERREGFWVLALSQKRVRLLKGSSASLEEVPVEHVPKSLADALRWEDFEKASLQFHMTAPTPSGGHPVVYHGTGEPDVKKLLLRFFRDIDRGLREHLGESTDPLILAGVEYLLPLYREVNKYPRLADDAVVGNPDALGEKTLHERAWEIASRVFSEDTERLLADIDEHWTSPRISADPCTIVQAAGEGRIDTLVISLDAGWWSRENDGVIRSGVPAVEEDLLERAALDTLSHSGKVVTVPRDAMPHGVEAVAVLRY